MATRASIAARVDLAGQSVNESMARIAAGLGIEVPPAASGIIGKNPELRGVFQQERVAAFLKTVAEQVGEEPAETPAESSEEPETETPSESDAEVVETESEADTTEPTFHGEPLSYYDGMSDQDIIDIDGIGPATLDKIKAARAERDAK